MTKKIILAVVIVLAAAFVLFLIDGYRQAPGDSMQPSDDSVMESEQDAMIKPVSEGDSMMDIEKDLNMELDSGESDFMQLDTQIEQL